MDIAAATGFLIDPHHSGAASVWQMWGRATTTADGSPNQSFWARFSYGAGLRATQFYTPNGYGYDGRMGANGRSLHVNGSRLAALNAAGQIRVRLLGRADSRHPLTLGFNIDLAGTTFGSARTAARLAPSGRLELVQVAPVRGNLLLGNKNDRGTLNSEFYLSLRAALHLNVRLGFEHLAAGYAFGGHRYQRFYNLAVVGFSYGLGSQGRYY